MVCILPPRFDPLFLSRTSLALRSNLRHDYVLGVSVGLETTANKNSLVYLSPEKRGTRDWWRAWQTNTGVDLLLPRHEAYCRAQSPCLTAWLPGPVFCKAIVGGLLPV